MKRERAPKFRISNMKNKSFFFTQTNFLTVRNTFRVDRSVAIIFYILKLESKYNMFGTFIRKIF